MHVLDNEEFMNEIIPSKRDMFLYYNRKEGILNHLVVFSPEGLYMENINISNVKFEEDQLSLTTDHWKFHLKYRQSWHSLLEGKKVIVGKSKAHIDVRGEHTCTVKENKTDGEVIDDLENDYARIQEASDSNLYKSDEVIDNELLEENNAVHGVAEAVFRVKQETKIRFKSPTKGSAA